MKSLREQVYEFLRKELAEGKLRPGSSVNLTEISKELGISKTPIREALQQSQIDTWIDWERIPVGERWWQEICEAIENANVFMFIISLNSIGSNFCKDEINHALKNKKRIIPEVD
ncbi:MAG: TIR domain-containing protein [Syntrophobacteraceae bacterium]|nr:TIR domain-containing protein [Syntrophobacteraceae bacterium]